MGMFDDMKDKATEVAGEHSDKVEAGLDKAGEAASNATGGKFDDQIESGKEAVSDFLGDSSGDKGSGDQSN